MLDNVNIEWSQLAEALQHADDRPVQAAEAICWYLRQHLGEVSNDEVQLLLRSFFLLPVARPSALYSLLLEVMLDYAEGHDEFNLVDFLQQWGLERNLRQDDRDIMVVQGVACPSLRQRAVHARVRYQFRHPATRDEACRRYILPMMAVKVYAMQQPVVRLVSPDGEELSVLLERLSVQQPVGKLFEVLRWYADGDEMWNDDNPLVLCEECCVTESDVGYGSGNGALRYEAIQLSHASAASTFPLVAGYVDRIDSYHAHIHIFDAFSRHFVADAALWQARVGQYVTFYPVVPKHSGFKSAVISELLPPQVGVHRFGFHTIHLMAYDANGAVFGWRLLDAECIVEAGTASPAYNSGYISYSFLVSCGVVAPCVGDVLRVNIFLKRAADGIKYPYICYACR